MRGIAEVGEEKIGGSGEEVRKGGKRWDVR